MVDPANPAAFRDMIYGADWKAWKDPDVPEMFDPTELLPDKHVSGDTDDRTALIVDNERYRLLATVCQTAHGLLSVGLEAENRILLFGNDSLDFIATWLGAVRAGIVPIVVSDQYKAPMLLISCATRRRRRCSSTPNRSKNSPRSRTTCRRR
jgi:hypothetical protein